jgi:RNA polymerase sigma-70 factor, ECF subfamily
MSTRSGSVIRGEREADAEREAFAHFFRSEYEGVVRVTFFIVRDRGRAEEIAQDAFVKAFDRWHEVGEYAHADAWVRRVAIRMAVRFARRERVRRQIEARATPEIPDEIDLGSGVVGALVTLPAKQRAAATLFYVDDRSVEDIAGILRCSPSTVKVHLYRARKALAATLEREVGHDADRG